MTTPPLEQPVVADLLVRCLEREGVTTVFGIPGEENSGLVDTPGAPGWAACSLTRPTGTGRSVSPVGGASHTIPVQARSISVRFTEYSFGSVRVDGVTYDHDLIIDRGKIRKRKKAASRKYRGAYGHTPLSIAEDIPWQCRRLVIGTGAEGALPVMEQVRDEARRREVDLVVLPTAEAIGVLTGTATDTNAILHLTC